MKDKYYSHYRWCRLLDRYLEAGKSNDKEEMAFVKLCMDKEKEKPNESYER